MVAETSASLRTFIELNSETSKKHRIWMKEGWAIGDMFVSLHVDALKPISRRTMDDPTDSDLGLVQLSCHGLNLYTSTLDLAVHGKFDVALHLLRALFDCGPLVYAVAKSDELAQRFDREKLKASEARRLQIADIGAHEQDLAAGLNNQWLREYESLNTATHVNPVHAEKLLHVREGKATPWVGGRDDVDECRKVFEAAHMGEFWHLSGVNNFRRELLGEQWGERFRDATKHFKDWMNKLRKKDKANKKDQQS